MEAMSDDLKGEAPASKPAAGLAGNQAPAGSSREELEREAMEEIAQNAWQDEVMREIAEEEESETSWVPD